MKKLIVTMALIAMVGVANAASFGWTSGTGQFYGVNNTGSPTFDLGGGSIVLVYLGTDAGNINWASASQVTWGTSGMTATLNTSTLATIRGRQSNTYLFDYATAGIDNGEIYGVMYKNSGGVFSNLKRVSDSTDITTTYTIAGLAANSWAGTSFAWTGNANFYAVPEPTSMALLGLGVAVLALRRKSRK